MRSLSPSLISSLALPVLLVHGFQVQAFAMPPQVGVSPSQVVGDAPAARRRANAGAGAPLRYKEADGGAVPVDALSLPAQLAVESRAATTVAPDGGAARGLARAAPLLALAAALVAATLGDLTFPAIAVPQSLRLLLAGAVAGVISRTACAPLEMASTVSQSHFALGDLSL